MRTEKQELLILNVMDRVETTPELLFTQEVYHYY